VGTSTKVGSARHLVVIRSRTTKSDLLAITNAPEETFEQYPKASNAKLNR